MPVRIPVSGVGVGGREVAVKVGEGSGMLARREGATVSACDEKWVSVELAF